MIKKIQILPEYISNKIAAGEVVQRPESVVKELMENALDAGATLVELYIKDAGKSLIQVTDDGFGMSEDDARDSILRHATSKITTFEDLEKIRTFGFRGEALSSIAAVSKLEIKTEQRDEDLGTIIRVEEEHQIIVDKGSFAKGTSVVVKNLFYNTPARRNFLKSNATELKHVTDTFKKFALSYPEIGFKFVNDDDVIYDLAPADLDERLSILFSDNINDALVEVKEVTDYLNITGYVSKPTFLRRSKGDQYLFINKRAVSSKIINHAVFTAYENILEKGEYPFFVLFLELDPAKVDINVHPSKLEVKFDDENGIYTFVQAVVRKSLGSYDLVPTMTFNTPNDEGEKLGFNKGNRVSQQDFADRPDYGSGGYSSRAYREESKAPNYSDDDIDLLFSSLNTEIKQNAPATPVEHPFREKQQIEVYHESSSGENDKQDAHDSSFIVLLHNKYILAQIKSGLMIIDAHVAHERILYEKALKSFNANIPFSQQLLFAQRVKLDPGDYALTKELYPHLIKLGFEINFMSKNNIEISGVPSDVNIGSEIDTLREILSEFKKNQIEKDLEIRDNVAKSYSCKAAIKAGDKISEREMKLLVDQLFATSMPYVCPHGRPIVIKIPLLELDRRFGRT
ncbi:MAG: DNA mismatch repair protein MutL [Melioribacteraceae bacterium]|nr:MAG: DNA mismatch repair protein MutL [Melioribacteraceae bacterium]